MKRPKICIFCGVKGNISKEHFWPQWLAAYLSSSTAHISELHEGLAKQPAVLQRRSERQGSVVTKKIRAVCTTCNNTWMSAAETKVKPIILRLLGGSGTVTVEEASSLAYWVALKSIVGEHASEGTALTPPQERHAFREQQSVPYFFRLFLAPHLLQSDSGYYRHSTTIFRALTGLSPPLPKGISRNIHATTFLVGKLCFYVTAIRAAGINAALLDPRFAMRCIWPLPNQPFQLEALPPLNALQVQVISRSLEWVVQHPAVKHGGPLTPEGHMAA